MIPDSKDTVYINKRITQKPVSDICIDVKRTKYICYCNYSILYIQKQMVNHLENHLYLEWSKPNQARARMTTQQRPPKEQAWAKEPNHTKGEHITREVKRTQISVSIEARSETGRRIVAVEMYMRYLKRGMFVSTVIYRPKGQSVKG